MNVKQIINMVVDIIIILIISSQLAVVNGM